MTNSSASAPRKATVFDRLPSLDGLRGWGALTVLLYHVFVVGFPSSTGQAETLRRAFIFNGELAVWVFFVVSGFSLSIGFQQSGDHLTVFRTAAGRYFRLAIPIGAASLLIWAVGPFLVHVSERPIEWRPYVTHAPTVIEALRFTFYDVFFRYSAKTSLMPQLWTMKYELFGSVAVFVSLLTFGRWRFREAGYIGVGGCLYFVHPIYCAFMVGAVLAAVFARGVRLQVASLWLLPAVLVGCAWLARNEPGRFSIPAAALITWCAVANLNYVGFLSNKVSRWLGSIAFPLYLTHSTVFFVFSLAMPPGLTTNFLTVVVALVLAQIFVPSDRLGIWISRKLGALAGAKLYLIRRADIQPPATNPAAPELALPAR